MNLNNATVKRLRYWISERYAIWLRRQRGESKPWTKDPILQQYKFCNVYREDDKTTVWIRDHWRTPAMKQPDLWFAMVVARLINRPSTLEALGIPLPWRPAQFIKLIHSRRDAGIPAFSGAYIVSTNGVTMDKAEYLAKRVLDPLWKSRESIRPRNDDTLASFHKRLMQYDGMGSFLAAQVVADMKYTPHISPVCTDWMTFAASGPGSRRGLNRVCGRLVNAPWREADWHRALTVLHAELVPDGTVHAPFNMHAQDLQNCLCEFDKYERVRLGEGRMKCTYKGGV